MMRASAPTTLTEAVAAIPTSGGGTDWYNLGFSGRTHRVAIDVNVSGLGDLDRRKERESDGNGEEQADE